MSAAPLVDAFLAHRATSELAGVPGAVRAYLAAARAHLVALHAAGRSGGEVNEMHSDLMDRLVRRLFELAEERYFSGGGEEQAGLCIVAVGGYARREMSFHSDVDLLFLYRDRLSEHVVAVAERVQQWLWDAQLAVGAATRTIGETLKLAREDNTVRTAVLAPRFLVGSGVLFHEFQNELRDRLFSDPAAFIEEQRRASAQRHAVFGDSLYLLQPNVKEGAGGLRDYHQALWVMQVSQPSARGLEDFLHLGLLTESEDKDHRGALDFLWRVRNELHRLAGRKNDQMSFEIQERIALFLGYDAAQGRELPVERFMSDYYRNARAVQNYSSLVLEQCEQRSGRKRRRRPRAVEEGFRIAAGQLEIPHARQLREEPLLLLRAFAVAQAHDVALTRKAQRLIREHLHLVDEDYRRAPEARETFFGILEAEKRVMRSLMTMNEVGMLAAFLPEWEHVVCRWQHVMYHTYTVDVHSIFLVEELRRLWLGIHAADHPELTELMRLVDDRSVLYLGCLLHDIGKGFGGNHSMKGVERAKPCLERLGLSAERQERVIFLVEHHLLMSHLAQRRDLSDPRLILDFAGTVGDRVNLRNLYLLTFADVRASSTKAWNDWKGSLLRELFERTAEVLETGTDDPGRALERIERRVEARREATSAELTGLGMQAEQIDAFFAMMPRRYITAHSARQMTRHAQVLLSLRPGELFATAVRELRGGISELILCTRDVHGLYANVAGAITSNDINILGAHVYSTRTGLALEVYRLATPPGGEEERQLAWEALEASLRRVLAGEVQVHELLERRRGALRRRGDSPAPKPPTVSISNDESEFYTIVDVTADDRLGLLHDLTRTITEQSLEIYISKAAKIEDQVADTFYLKDAAGKKVVDPAALESLRRSLLAVLEPAEASRAG